MDLPGSNEIASVALGDLAMTGKIATAGKSVMYHTEKTSKIT